MYPVAEDKREGGAAHDQPQDQALQQRANAHLGERLFVQARADQKQGGWRSLLSASSARCVPTTL
jgi:hypothetical protein